MNVSGIGSSATKISLCGMVDINISNHHGKTPAMEAVVLSKVTTVMPQCLVPFNIQLQMEAFVKHSSG